MEAPSPGWYLDPADRRCIRWWDGTEWTAYSLDIEKRSLHFNPPPNWPVPSEAEIPEPGWRPDPEWGPVPDGWPLWIDARGEPVPPVPWQGASARQGGQSVGGRTEFLAHGAFALGLWSLLLALLAFITVVTEDEIGKSSRSDWFALVAFASPSALFGVLALWSGRRPAPLGVRVEAWIGIVGSSLRFRRRFSPGSDRRTLRRDQGVSHPAAGGLGKLWADTLENGRHGAVCDDANLAVSHGEGDQKRVGSGSSVFFFSLRSDRLPAERPSLNSPPSPVFPRHPRARRGSRRTVRRRARSPGR